MGMNLEADLSEIEGLFTRLEGAAGRAAAKGLYKGAGIVADAVKQSISGLPIDERHVKDGEMLTGITRQQKAGLIDGFGIAPLKDENGYLNVKLGFDGYNSVKTKSFPNGQPNSMIARSVNSGTSFRQRIPFVDSTVSANKAACEQKMKDTFDQALKSSL